MDTTGGSPLRKRNRMTFLRQNYLDQVPGVETHNRLLSADLYRLPSRPLHFALVSRGKVPWGEGLVNHCGRNTYANLSYRMVISKAFNKVKASGKERVACLILFLSGSIL